MPEPNQYARGQLDERLNEAVRRLELVTTKLENLPCAQHGAELCKQGAWITTYKWVFGGFAAIVAALAAWLWAHIAQKG